MITNKFRTKMKKLIYGITFLTIVCSCKQSDRQPEPQSSKPTNPIYLADSTEFVGKHKTDVMILGVFHFANPQKDSYKPKFEIEVLSEKRQLEIDELLTKIAEYRPTKILIEANRKRSDSLLNAHYSNYLNDDFDISKETNEIFQLGFKLAKKMSHKVIYSTDARADWFGVELDWDNYDEEAYLKSTGQYIKSTRYNHDVRAQLLDSLKTTMTLTEFFRIKNNPLSLLKNHQQYLTDVVLEGAGDNYLGADSAARWYRRNLRIFANAYDIVDFNKEERILMIYGAGHVWTLRQFFKDSPDFDYVEVNDYLTE